MDNKQYSKIAKIYGNDNKDKRQQIHDYFVSKSIKDNIKKYGEVLTMPCLVDNMLETIPFDFWFAPKHVLEPCCGKGNFLLAIFDKFFDNMYHLSVKERIYLIINECITFCDINANNVEICNQLLELHIKNKCPEINMEKIHFRGFVCDGLKFYGRYDLVATNPPYNSNGTLASGNSLYQKFIKKALNDNVVPSGYVLFVTPPSWRKPSTSKCKYHGIFDLMTKENQMLYVKMNNSKEGRKMFAGCDTKFDYYLIQNRVCDQDTLVIDYNNEEVMVDLRKHSFLPNFEINMIYSLLAGGNEAKLRIFKCVSKFDARNKNTSYVETDEFKHKLVHSTPLTGTRFIYCKEKDDTQFARKKVIIGYSGIKHVVNDYDGLYGTTNNTFGIDIDSREHGDLLDKAFLSVRFKKVLKAISFGNYNVDFIFLSSLKDVFYLDFI